ncbi:unnamed protein product, partial [Oppiella nova]
MHLIESMDTNSDSLILNIFHSNESPNKKAKLRQKVQKKAIHKRNTDNSAEDNADTDGKTSPDRSWMDRTSSRPDRRAPGGDRRADKRADNRFSYAKLNSRLFDSASQDVPPIHIVDTKSRVEPVFSSHNYSELSLHPYLVKCLSDRLSISETTSVQQNSIPALMSGSD